MACCQFTKPGVFLVVDVDGEGGAPRCRSLFKKSGANMEEVADVGLSTLMLVVPELDDKAVGVDWLAQVMKDVR